MTFQHFAQVSDDDIRRIDHGATEHRGLRPIVLRNPLGGQSERGILNVIALQRDPGSPRMDRQHMSNAQRRTSRFLSRDQNSVLLIRELSVVADADERNP